MRAGGGEAKGNNKRRGRGSPRPVTPETPVETPMSPAEPPETVLMNSPSLEMESPDSPTSGDSLESNNNPPAGDTASVDSGVVDPTCPDEATETKESSLSGPAEESPSTRIDISNTHLAPETCTTTTTTSTTTTTTGAQVDGPCVSKVTDEQIESISRERSETNTSQSSAEVVSVRDVDALEGVVGGHGHPPGEELLLQMEKEEFINAQGVKFTQDGVSEGAGGVLVPYGMPCVKEVFRFLISLTSPSNTQNTPAMIHTALSLLVVGLEVGADHINGIPSLLNQLKVQLCKNLFLLLKPDTRLSIFTSALRLCTLFCDSLRTHFKFQIEMFLGRLVELITSESPSVTYTYKELALETVVQLWRIPGFITELFLNYDCSLYCTNVFEDMTKVLSKNAFPVSGLYSTNLLSLEALFTVIETIESHGPKDVNKRGEDGKLVPLVVAPVSSGYLLGLGLRGGFSPVTPQLKSRTVLTDDKTISREHLLALKEKKKLLATGTDQFNVNSDRGIKFLQENGIVGTTSTDIALFLRENPRLCKNMLGDYLSKKRNIDILAAFTKSFEFRSLRLDEALRMYLENFRLPGEAPLISIIVEHFSSHWHSSNDRPFLKDDAAFTLVYAVIMLNMDQHNPNVKRQNMPMTLDQFRNNVRGVNGGQDFDQDMLEEIYTAIHREEIIMPSEHVGALKENYDWKLLIKRGATKEGEYILANGNMAFDRDLFAICWGPTIASLSYVFDKSTDDVIIQRAISGFQKCASISARYGKSDVFDNLVVSLCKFTTLSSSTDAVEHIAASFGANKKAKLAARTVFQLTTSHGDILRDGWKNILELLLQLFRCRLLPSGLVESEDFVETSGKVSLMRETPTTVPRVESSLLSSLYSYISLGDAGMARGTNPEDIENAAKARTCIQECHPEKILSESAFLRSQSLDELLKAMMAAADISSLGQTTEVLSAGGDTTPQEITPSGAHTTTQDEHCQAFMLELIVQVLLANKDRAYRVWKPIGTHIYSLLMGAAAADRQFLLERCVVALLRLAKVLLRRPDLGKPILLSLRMLLLLRPAVVQRISQQVVCGMREVSQCNVFLPLSYFRFLLSCDLSIFLSLSLLPCFLFSLLSFM